MSELFNLDFEATPDQLTALETAKRLYPDLMKAVCSVKKISLEEYLILFDHPQARRTQHLSPLGLEEISN